MNFFHWLHRLFHKTPPNDPALEARIWDMAHHIELISNTTTYDFDYTESNTTDWYHVERKGDDLTYYPINETEEIDANDLRVKTDYD